MNKTGGVRVLAALLVFLLALSFCHAVKTDLDINLSSLQSDALLAYNKIAANEASLGDMNQRGIATTRVSDEIFVATQLFENAYLREKDGNFADYSKSVAQSNQTADLIALALLTKDELDALGEEVNSVKGQIDFNQVQEIYTSAQNEFKDQRFEKSREYIDQTYSKISELQSVQAKTGAIYAAARKNLEIYIIENWWLLAAIIMIPVVLYFLFRKRVTCAILRYKHEVNDVEISVLKDEIKGTQTTYFIKGVMAEGTYQIKTRIYGDKIRELNKQNALLEEQMAQNGCAVAPKQKPFAYKGNKEKKAARRK